MKANLDHAWPPRVCSSCAAIPTRRCARRRASRSSPAATSTGCAPPPREPLTRRSGSNPELMGLPPEHPTLPSLLRGAGYRTGGRQLAPRLPATHFGPLRAADEFFGPISGAVDYFSYLSFEGKRDLFDGEEPARAQGYLDVISDRACDFVRRHAGRQPFLLSVHYTAPHWFWETRDDEGRVAAHRDEDPSRRRRVSAGVPAHDPPHGQGIGRISRRCASAGWTTTPSSSSRATTAASASSDVWTLRRQEDGPARRRAARAAARPLAGAHPRRGDASQPMMTMDWMPTLLDAAGVAPDPLYPSTAWSMLDVLHDADARRERPMFWRMKYREQRAAISGVEVPAARRPRFLFNIRVDVRERANLAARASRIASGAAPPLRRVGRRRCRRSPTTRRTRWSTGRPRWPARRAERLRGAALERPRRGRHREVPLKLALRPISNPCGRIGSAAASPVRGRTIPTIRR